jgi:hypothetical protein
LRIKEQETCLTLQEHDDDDDDPFNQKEAGECCNGSIKHPCGTVHSNAHKVIAGFFLSPDPEVT